MSMSGLRPEVFGALRFGPTSTSTGVMGTPVSGQGAAPVTPVRPVPEAFELSAFSSHGDIRRLDVPGTRASREPGKPAPALGPDSFTAANDLMRAEREIGNGDFYFDAQEYTAWNVREEIAQLFGCRFPVKLLDDELFFGVARPEGIELGRVNTSALRLAAYHEYGHVLYGHLGRPSSLRFEREADYFAGFMHALAGHPLLEDSVKPFWTKPVLPHHDGAAQRIATIRQGYEDGLRDRQLRLPELPVLLHP